MFDSSKKNCRTLKYVNIYRKVVRKKRFSLLYGKYNRLSENQTECPILRKKQKNNPPKVKFRFATRIPCSLSKILNNKTMFARSRDHASGDKTPCRKEETVNVKVEK
jgi:hypothetical protein